MALAHARHKIAVIFGGTVAHPKNTVSLQQQTSHDTSSMLEDC